MRLDNVNEWIYYYFIKDEEALPLLMEHFTPVINSLYNLFSQKKQTDYFSRDELDSLAYITLVDCLDRYRINSNSPFYMYYYVCLKRKVIDSIRYIQHSSFPPTVKTVSLDTKVRENANVYYRDIIYDSKMEEHEYVLEKCHVDSVMNQAHAELNEMDYEILKLKLDGYSVKYISDVFNVSKQYVYYRLKKIRNWFTSH